MLNETKFVKRAGNDEKANRKSRMTITVTEMKYW